MKINIVRQDSLKYNKAKRIRRINTIVTVSSLSLFVLSVIWVGGQFVYLGLRTNSLQDDIKTLEKMYTSRSDEVASYVSIKQIVGTVAEIQKGRFKYKEFLNTVYKLLPLDANLTAVDFGQKGVVIVSVRMKNLTSYDLLMANISQSASEKDFLFSEIAQSRLTRESLSGLYLVTLEMKIK